MFPTMAILFALLMMCWACYNLGKQAGQRWARDRFNRLDYLFDQLAAARKKQVAAMEEQIGMLRKAAGLPEIPAKQVEGEAS